ncbi:MAG: oligosaccharide flippase family protein [Candidatus Methanofastidiosum sp.]|nr:oligosaccharide flippase family protein [Methanofastidiosum sp.]
MGQMSEHKLFAQRAGLISFTYVIIYLMRILLVPILTKNMPIEEYGTWVQVNATLALIPPLLGLGLPFGLVRFLPSNKNKNDLQEGFYSVFFVVILVSGIASFLFLFFSKPLAMILFDNNIEVATIIPIIFFIESLINIPISLFRALQKIKRHSIFLILDMAFTVSFASYFILLGYGIFGAVSGLLISKILVLAGMMIYVLKDIGFIFPKFINLREYLNFSIPMLPNNFSNWILNSSDRYVITIFLGTAFTGYYAPGYTVGHLISIFSAPLFFLLPPVLSKYYDEKKFNEFNKVLRYSTKYYLLIAIPSVCGLSILSKAILRILTTPEIANIGYLITPYTAVSYLLYGLQVMIGYILMVEKKTKIIGSVMSISAIMNLGLNIIVVPIMGIDGAALTTLISFIFAFLIILYCSSKAKLFRFDIGFIMKSVIASIIMSLMIIYLNPVDIFPLILSIFLGALLYFGIIMGLKGIKKEEIKFFLNLVSK